MRCAKDEVAGVHPRVRKGDAPVPGQGGLGHVAGREEAQDPAADSAQHPHVRDLRCATDPVILYSSGVPRYRSVARGIVVNLTPSQGGQGGRSRSSAIEKSRFEALKFKLHFEGTRKRKTTKHRSSFDVVGGGV